MKKNNLKILKENTEQFEKEYKDSLETYDSSVSYLTKINTLVKDINEEVNNFNDDNINYFHGYNINKFLLYLFVKSINIYII